MAESSKLKRKDNISTIFLLPCLQIRQEIKDKFYEMGFVNTYLFFDKQQYSFIPLYLVFSAKEYDLNFYKFSLMLEKNPNYVETLDYPGNSVVFVFKIPKRFEKDYELFLKGRYSKFSKEYKDNFPMKVHKVDSSGRYIKDKENQYVTDNSVFYHIFNKTDYLKDVYMQNLRIEYDELPDELYDRYKKEEETLLL